MSRSLLLKRLVSVCLVLLFAAATLDCASSDDSLFSMQSLGIMDKIGEKSPAAYATRAEFAQMVVNLLQYQDIAEQTEPADYFTDIGQSPYKNAINLLYRLGYISGDGNGRFFPDDLISYAAACKIFVYALGYDAIASEHTLSEYMFIAGDIGISKNVGSSGDGLTYGQLAVMFYNVLDIAMMVPVYFGDGSIVSYQADQGKTFRNYIENKNGAGLVEKTGIVTADASTFLYMPAHLKDTQIQIDGKTYYYNGTAPRGYVGQRVAYYVMVDDYEESVVVSIAPDTKNDIHNFSYEEIDEIAADKIKYSSENGACQIGLNYATRYIYNNRLDLDYDVTGLRTASNFVVRTIDNNEDSIADVVFVYQYTDCIVEAVFEDTLTVVLKEGYAFENQKNIQLDQDRRSYEVFTPDGILTDFSAIEKDAVISVAASTDGEMVRIVIGRPKTEGVITQVYEDGMTLDNTDYQCDDSELLETAKLGVRVMGYLNFMNVLVAVEETEAAEQYGYVYQYGTSAKGPLYGYSVKLLLPEYITVKVTEGEADEMSGEVETSQSLYVRNKDVVVYDVGSKVLFNGTKMNAEAALQQVLDTPVSYEFDSSGSICKINTLEGVDSARINSDPVMGTTLNTKKYNATELLFGGGKGRPFAIEENKTLAFCVPKYQEEGQAKQALTDDDLKVFAELINNVGYEVNGYAEDADTHVTDVLVVQRIMKSGQMGAITATSKVGMVIGISKVLEDDGTTEKTYIEMYTDNREQSIEVSDLLYHSEAFLNLGAGDLIAYTLDGFDCVNAAVILQEFREYYDFMGSDKICGEIKNIDYDEISNGKIRRVHNVDVGFGDSDTVLQTLEILVKNPAPIFVIEGDMVRLGSVSDLRIGDRISASLNGDHVRAIGIKR